MVPQFTDFLYRDNVLWIAAFTLGGLAFALGPIAIVYLLMPRKTRQINNKAEQYIECGMDPIGDSWIRYGVVFYLYALIFLAFDVDVLFLFPVSTFTTPKCSPQAPSGLYRNHHFYRNFNIGGSVRMDQGSI